MNWIILIVAGLSEVGFTYCLGRGKSVGGKFKKLSPAEPHPYKILQSRPNSYTFTP